MSKFIQVCSTLWLTIVTRLYIISSNLILKICSSHNCKFVPFDQHLPISPNPPTPGTTNLLFLWIWIFKISHLSGTIQYLSILYECYRSFFPTSDTPVLPLTYCFISDPPYKGDHRVKDDLRGTSLVFQQLKLHTPNPMKGTWIWSLIQELKSHMPHGVAKKLFQKST